jgi:GNAT superfamily N-acetyltransferase
MRAIPLTKTNRVKVARAFSDHKRYDLTLESVIEGQMGKAFTNNIEDMKLIRVEIEPFNYFAGDPAHSEALTMVKTLKPNSFVLPSQKGFEALIHHAFENQVHVMNRYLYDASHLDRESIISQIETFKPLGEISRIDLKRAKSVFEDHKSMIYLKDFESASDFYERGLGFVMEIDGKIIGAAYSTIISGAKAQIALNVSHAYRKQGIATILALHFVKHCLENHIEPVWVANNPETCKLAEKIGFKLDVAYSILYIAEA